MLPAMCHLLKNKESLKYLHANKNIMIIPANAPCYVSPFKEQRITQIPPY